MLTARILRQKQYNRRPGRFEWVWLYTVTFHQDGQQVPQPGTGCNHSCAGSLCLAEGVVKAARRVTGQPIPIDYSWK